MANQARESKDYASKPQQRIIKLFFKLAGNEVDGVNLKLLADAMGCNESMCFRDLQNLKEAGAAEQLDNSNWRLTPKLVQIAIAYQNNIQRAQSKVNEVTNRYTRQP